MRLLALSGVWGLWGTGDFIEGVMQVLEVVERYLDDLTAVDALALPGPGKGPR